MKCVKYTLLLLAFFFLKNAEACGPGTPSFTVNLVGQPNGTYTSPSIQRNDTCCGALAPNVCIKFTIFLDPNAIGINFQIVSGAVPSGALYYQINCGPPIAVGSPICLSGPGPHILTFCKPGNNPNGFAINSIPGPVVPDSITVRNGCSATLAVSGYSVPTINWNSINPGPPGAYNGYLNCVSGCSSVIVTPTGTPPAFVDYLVSGYVQAPCQANFHQDTVRVYFYSSLLAGINPTLTTLCFGQSNALLTATVTGGVAPYTYTWSNGSNSPTVNVGPGTYTVTIGDNTNCPPTTATAVVNSFSLPITANAGPDQNLCKTSPNAVLHGTIGMAGGGIWSGGTGTYTPNNTALTMTYIPTPSEIATGSVQLTLTSTGNQGCPGASDVVVLNFQNLPVANAGSTMSVCANNNLISLNGSITGYSSTPQWSSSGSGVFTSTSNLTTTYTPSNADITAGSVNFTLTTQNNGVCPASSSTVHIAITPAPVVNAGPSQTICSNAIAVLSGSVTGPTNTGAWSTGGDGAFNPSPNLLNTTYIPGPNDINTGIVTLTLTSTGNGNCLPVTSTVAIVIKKLAVVNVSPSQTICSNAGTISLTGTITGGTATGLWSTNGSGSFNPGPGSLNTTYNITPADITMGTVNFTLSSTNNSPCPATTNTLSVSIHQIALVNAGVNQVLCATTTTIALNGTVNTGNGVWTSNGGGTYNPNNISLSTTYSITPFDINQGFVSFTLSSTNNGPCPQISDSVMITIKKTATVNVSPSQTICSTTSSISLTGTITGGTASGIWTTNGSGSFNPGPGVLNTSYLITPSDITMGTVIFTLTSTNNAPCVAASNTLSVTIYQLAQVNAGVNQALCETSGTIGLSGIVNTGNGVWSSNGGGTYNPNQISLNTTYSFTPFDINQGFVNFTLTSTNNGPCPAVSDSVMITIKKTATVNVSPSQTICSTTSSISLTGTITGGTSSGMWTTNGSGAFNPGPGSVNTSYFITPGDITMGTVIFTLTSTNNAPCVAASNTLSVTIYQLAQVNAGINQALCETSGTIGLSGNVNTGNGVWTSNGNGTYNPNQISLNTTYSITPSDINQGFVNFTLTSTNNGPCPAVSDSVMITIKKTPTVNVSPSQTICSTTSSISLSGTVTGGTSSGIWTTNGSGAFNNGPAVLSNTYFVTPSDITMGTVIFTLTSTNNAPCAAASNTLSVTIYQLAQVNAGINQALCETSGTIGLSGNVNTGNGVWTSNGNGTYNPNQISLTTTYSMTPSDINQGFVTFTLTSTNNGPCPAISDSVMITIKKTATVNVSPSQTICSSTSSISLTGTITGGTATGLWTTDGSGAFNNGPGSLNNSYFVTPADIIAGTVNFTLTSTNNAPCAAVSNTLSLTIYQLATVNAGPNQFLCESNGTVALNGLVNTGNGVWTSNGGGSYNPSNISLNTTYSFTPLDVNNGSVTFTLSSTNNGPCPTVSDSVKIAIKKMATVDAGLDQSICSTTGSISLNGIVGGGSSSGIWTTNGNGGFAPGPGALNSSYIVSIADVGLGSVIFTVTSTNNGPCPAVSDTTLLKIYQLAQVSAGPNQALCETAGTLSLTGFVNTGNGMWSGGTGTYTPNNITLNPTYSITSNDINAGFVTFTLASTNNGPCPAIQDTVKITLKKLAVVNAGGDKAVCSTNSTVFLSGNVSIGSNSGAWSGNGSGSFMPNNTSLNTTYNISGGDMSAGSVTVVLTSLNNGVCPAVTDTAVIKIYRNPSIHLSQDTTVCTYQNPLRIKPNVSGDYGLLQWSTSGSGSFLPTNFANPVTYDFTKDIPSVVVTLSISALNNGPCANINASIKVTIRPSPKAGFTPSTYTANIPNDPVTFTNHSFQANAYEWSFGDGSSSGAVNPVHNYQTVGYYNITLVALNQFGCSDTAVDHIKVVSDIQFPNAFTPNTQSGNGGSFRTDDYSNDVFFPYTAYEGVTGYDLQIFNRWGELIFESKNVLQGWDGYFKGKLCQQDVYVWKAKVEFFDGRLYTKTGSVTLLR